MKWRYPRNGVLCYNNAHILQIPYIILNLYCLDVSKENSKTHAMLPFVCQFRNTRSFLLLNIYRSIFVVSKFAPQNVILQYPAKYKPVCFAKY